MQTKTNMLLISVLLSVTVLIGTSYADELKGKVIYKKDNDVTIRYDGEGVPQEGDKVELSFTIGEYTVPVGTWKVTSVKDDGTVEASPVEIIGDPSIDNDAIIHATGIKADKIKQEEVPPPAKKTPKTKEKVFQRADITHIPKEMNDEMLCPFATVHSEAGVISISVKKKRQTYCYIPVSTEKAINMHVRMGIKCESGKDHWYSTGMVIGDTPHEILADASMVYEIDRATMMINLKRFRLNKWDTGIFYTPAHDFEGKKNIIGMEKIGKKYNFFLNEKKIAEWVDTVSKSGKVWIFFKGGQGGRRGARIEFSDIKVSRLH